MGQIPRDSDEPEDSCGLTASNVHSRRVDAREDDVWPNVYKVLDARRMLAIGRTLGIDNPRLLVTVRHVLAGLFLDQLRSMAGDPRRNDIRERRRKLNAISALVTSLHTAYRAALPDIMHDHVEADWHAPARWGPSHFQYDYEQLLDGTRTIQVICDDILQSAAFRQSENKGVGPKGLPAKLSDRPGSWAKEAFAIRLAGLFRAATGRAITVGNSQDTAFQKFAAECIDIFQESYRKLGNPFGVFVPPSRRDLNDARARHK